MSKREGPRRPGDSKLADGKRATRQGRRQATVRTQVYAPDAEHSFGARRVDKICGLAAVTALFRVDPQRVLRLYYSERHKSTAGPLCAVLAERRQPYRMVSEHELERVAGTLLHGGIVAAALPRLVRPFDLANLRAWSEAREAVVLLDGVGNPNNIGAIARTMAFFGFRRLLLSDHPAQSGLSDASYRVAEGGLEYLDIRAIATVPAMLREFRSMYRVVATVVRGGSALSDLASGSRPICLVLGNEEQGLCKATLRACESTLTVAGSGWVESLNVSAFAAVVLSRIATTGF